MHVAARFPFPDSSVCGLEELHNQVIRKVWRKIPKAWVISVSAPVAGFLVADAHRSRKDALRLPNRE